MAFVFYDTETTGSEPFYDQILQFAAILTDDDLIERDSFEIRCRLQPHIVPSPGALLVTGVTIDRITDPALPSHYQMVASIREKLLSWSPAVFAGYNSLEFDEDLLRQALYQTLHPPFLTNTNGNSRLDVLQLILAINEFESGVLIFPPATTASRASGSIRWRRPTATSIRRPMTRSPIRAPPSMWRT